MENCFSWTNDFIPRNVWGYMIPNVSKSITNLQSFPHQTEFVELPSLEIKWRSSRIKTSSSQRHLLTFDHQDRWSVTQKARSPWSETDVVVTPMTPNYFCGFGFIFLALFQVVIIRCAFLWLSPRMVAEPLFLLSCHKFQTRALLHYCPQLSWGW